MNERSKQIRRDTITLSKANGGYHYGGSFSCVEILISLFDYVLKDEDKFILSKGHACWPYYVLLREKGFTPKLEGHPTRDEMNGIYCTTGSLGHGFPTGVGMAMARKMSDAGGKVYVLVGDGECQEGTTWESLQIAARYKLDNLIVIVDYNQIQGSGFLENILPLDNLGQVADAIGWDAVNVDGHDCLAMQSSFFTRENRPLMVIAHTIKGRGVSYMENKPAWHAKWPDKEHEQIALEELKGE